MEDCRCGQRQDTGRAPLQLACDVTAATGLGCCLLGPVAGAGGDVGSKQVLMGCPLCGGQGNICLQQQSSPYHIILKANFLHLLFTLLLALLGFPRLPPPQPLPEPFPFTSKTMQQLPRPPAPH